jgi:Lar family restriction alleviation protein
MTDMPIKPCPFCGDQDPAIDEIDNGIWALCCNNCMTIGPHQDGEQSPAEASRKWNERK